MLLLISPFIKVYTSGVTDISYLDDGLVWLFTAVYVLQALKVPCISLTEVAGHFKETRTQAIIEIVLNLSLSLLFIQMMGIYGILLGTIIANAYRDIALVQYVSKTILWGSYKEIYRSWLKNAALMLASVWFGKMAVLEKTNWSGLITSGIGVTSIVSVIFGLGNIHQICQYIHNKRGG